jgi:hypothetical protein
MLLISCFFGFWFRFYLNFYRVEREIERVGNVQLRGFSYSPRSEKVFTPGKVGPNNLEPEAKYHTPSMDRPTILSQSIFFIDSQQTSPLAPDVKDLEETYMNPTLSRPIKLCLRFQASKMWAKELLILATIENDPHKLKSRFKYEGTLTLLLSIPTGIY